MKKVLLLLALLTGCFSLTLQAQTNNAEKQVSHIRSVYNQVKKEIASMKRNNPNNPYYRVHCENNAWDKPYPGSGTHISTTDYYYRLSDETRDRVLVMVIKTERVAAVKIYTEILYEDGQCIFFYENDPYETDPEKRLYMDAFGNTIRYTEGDRKIGPTDETKESLFKDWAKEYIDLFYLL